MISDEKWKTAVQEINEDLKESAIEADRKEILSIKLAGEIHLRDEINKYASWLIEAKRKELGLKYDDTSRDAEIIAKLKSGEKLSKSKHMEDK